MTTSRSAGSAAARPTVRGVPDRGFRWLLGSLVLVGLVSVAGVAAGGADSAWYDSLDKAPWNPPGWVFGVVWPLLYVAMAIAAWLVIRAGLAGTPIAVPIGLYLVQLGLNLAWTWLFFGWQAPGWALVDLTLLVAVVGCAWWAFGRVDRRAGWLLVPYLAWLLFALSLNAWIVAAS